MVKPPRIVDREFQGRPAHQPTSNFRYSKSIRVGWISVFRVALYIYAEKYTETSLATRDNNNNIMSNLSVDKLIS